MNAVTFTVVGIAQPKGSLKAYVPKGWQRPVLTSDNPRTKGWQQLVATQAQDVVRLDRLSQFVGPVALRVRFVLPRPASLPARVKAHTKKPDLDKLIRNVGDALRGVFYRDDAQIVELQGQKRYAEVGTVPHAEITISAAAPPEPAAGTLPGL